MPYRQYAILPYMSSKLGSAGELLRRARTGARLTQAELAARAGVTQSVISAYESGHRQPALSTLTALIEASGYDLVLDVRPQPRRLSKLTGPVGRRVCRTRRELLSTAAAHGVTNLRVFGSVARGEDRRDSDLDLLADLPAGMSLFGLGRLEAELESIVRTRVDLVSAEDLKPGVRPHVEADQVRL